MSAWQRESAASLASLALMKNRTAPTQSSPENATATRSSAAAVRSFHRQPSLMTGAPAARLIASTISG